MLQPLLRELELFIQLIGSMFSLDPSTRIIRQLVSLVAGDN